MRPRQLTFFKTESFRDLNRRAHGGDLRIGKRKLARPFDPKKPLHVVLRSTRAQGEWSMLKTRNEKKIRDLVFREARRAGVRVYRFANAGNHLHILLKADRRRSLARFLRITAGLIARLITGAKKGAATSEKGALRKFWDRLAYSRIVEWGKEFHRVSDYLVVNELEGLGWSDLAGRESPIIRRQRGPRGSS
jgi:REP element-mobilizing transposase RayT